ncbi:MAG: tetratricopeptide repeat protein [Candidatus Omnitrophica bacterium]|nr:tetratricopeptide repeat protein [Candidatus Omnitrophota bacterium]
MTKVNSRRILLLLFCILSLAGCKKGRELALASEFRALQTRAWRPFLAFAQPRQDPRALCLTHYLAGLLAEEQGDLKAAVAEYQKARRHDPQALRVALRLGAAHMHLNDLGAATRSFEEACALEPTDPRPRFLLGLLYASQERFDEAAKQYSMVLDQDPANLGALSQLADLYMSQERLQQALQVYEKLLKERPYSAVAHFNTGVIYAKAGQWPDAIEHFREAVALDPGHQEARLGLAVCLELSQNPEAAKAEYLECLKQEPSNVRLMEHLSDLSQRMGSLEESAEWLARYLSFRPRDAQGYLKLAYLRIEQGRWREAAGLLQTALSFQNLEGLAVDLGLALGLAYEKGGDYAQAEKAYWETVMAGPGQAQPHLFLARLFHSLGRLEEAETAYRSVLELSPDDLEAMNGLAYLYAQRGERLEEALSLVEKVLRVEPESGAYLDTLGWIYFRMGRLEEALPVLRAACERSPDAEVLEHLGQVYLSLGMTREAGKVKERIRQLRKVKPNKRSTE